MIYVMAMIEVSPGRKGDFLAVFTALVPKVRAEKGCIEYGPTVDLPTGPAFQTPVGENFVVVVEKWDSVQALEDHLASPHMLAYRQAVEGMVAGVAIHVLEPV
jgi:quinol monooxygenase YgiN